MTSGLERMKEAATKLGSNGATLIPTSNPELDQRKFGGGRDGILGQPGAPEASPQIALFNFVNLPLCPMNINRTRERMLFLFFSPDPTMQIKAGNISVIKFRT